VGFEMVIAMDNLPFLVDLTIETAKDYKTGVLGLIVSARRWFWLRAQANACALITSVLFQDVKLQLNDA